MQQSESYSVDNYAAEIFLTFNIRDLILKTFLQSESSNFLYNKYCDYCWNDFQIQFQRSNSQNFPAIGKVYSY